MTKTLEEVAEKLYPVFNRSTPFGSKYPWTPQKERNAFIEGAKWQQKQDKNKYNEEELHLILGSYSAHKLSFNHEYTYDMWFEQFKKK